MSDRKYPQEFLDLLARVRAKQPRIVIEHILQHGFITTEELARDYGYAHPPRAARDVREQGIPLETFTVRNSEGKSIAAYRFAPDAIAQNDRIGGRSTFSKAFRQELIALNDSRCSICSHPFDERYLQIDHRIPYMVGGESQGKERRIKDYMVVCGSCNRAKSWSCEHCPNPTGANDPEICRSCYWAYPESYRHIALRTVRRLDIVWTEDEVSIYERIKAEAGKLGTSMPEFVKAVLRNHLTDI